MPRGHFEREAYLQLAVLLGPLLLGLLFTAVGLVVFRVAEEVSIDRCLDRGGAWDFDEAGCRASGNQPRPVP